VQVSAGAVLYGKEIVSLLSGSTKSRTRRRRQSPAPLGWWGLVSWVLLGSCESIQYFGACGRVLTVVVSSHKR
jgi:hypothetical protein